ncbi:hypothetical protein PPERSA_06259 [Pseudocohnilembus persalinus]|uniref:Uncharacterized protein n=1 Tax=Pseudocohnilembus persalinus TaxID=266149 RepID=A0A0V0QWA0_PSEPJ|nr:hypothetical protein PPERSA_06259 [Pseudocohnilembus persalinus]|eukprot:KRX06288.1 hypothetical protein PPERSA_06259 [Pseudocohnilembus persalinus]
MNINPAIFIKISKMEEKKINKFIDNYSMFSESLQFLNAYNSRIVYTLQNPERLVNQARATGHRNANNQISNEQCVLERSLGCLDELEYTLNLMAAYYITQVEKILQNIEYNSDEKDMDTKSQQLTRNDIQNTSRKTSQFDGKSHTNLGGATSFYESVHRQNTSRNIVMQGLAPSSMFNLLINIQYLNILMTCGTLMNNALDYSQFYQILDRQAISQEMNPKIKSIQYSPDFWQILSSSYKKIFSFLTDCIAFAKKNPNQLEHNLQMLESLCSSVDFVSSTGQLGSLMEIPNQNKILSKIVQIFYVFIDSGISYLVIWKNYLQLYSKQKPGDIEFFRQQIDQALSLFVQEQNVFLNDYQYNNQDQDVQFEQVENLDILVNNLQERMNSVQ